MDDINNTDALGTDPVEIAAPVVDEPVMPMGAMVTVAVGQEVRDSEGETLGKVKEVRADDFLLDRHWNRDVYAPLSAVAKVDEHVHLNLTKEDIKHVEWEVTNLLDQDGDGHLGS